MMLSGNNVCVLNIQWIHLVGAHRRNSTHRYLPIMIGRLMLSLKRAADTTEVGWSLTGMTHTSNSWGGTQKRSNSVRFAPASDEDTVLPTEDIPLAVVPVQMS